MKITVKILITVTLVSAALFFASALRAVKAASAQIIEVQAVSAE